MLENDFINLKLFEEIQICTWFPHIPAHMWKKELSLPLLRKRAQNDDNNNDAVLGVKCTAC